MNCLNRSGLHIGSTAGDRNGGVEYPEEKATVSLLVVSDGGLLLQVLGSGRSGKPCPSISCAGGT